MTESPRSDVRDNVRRIRGRIAEAALKAGRDPAEITLMAVTKTQPPSKVNEAVAAGITLLGENRAQELLAKYGDYHKEGVSIHFIGGLQTNKVRQVIGRVDMIQSLDSLRLAAEIERQAALLGRVTDVLVEVNIAGEPSKSGVAPEDAASFAGQIREYPHLRLRGLMAIPPIYGENSENDHFFYRMRQLFVDIKDENVDNKNIDILSMGMSDDFEAAIRHGSTLVRIGSALFGARA